MPGPRLPCRTPQAGGSRTARPDASLVTRLLRRLGDLRPRAAHPAAKASQRAWDLEEQGGREGLWEMESTGGRWHPGNCSSTPLGRGRAEMLGAQTLPEGPGEL